MPRLCSRPFLRGLLLLAAAITGLGFARSASAAGPLHAIGIENEYADVIAQIAGSGVVTSAIMSDPNTDPHSFEVSPRIGGAIAQADLVVLNGLGYDDWAAKMLKAAPKADRIVIDVQTLRGLPDSTPNPHLWYDPATMPAVAKAVAAALAKLDPSHAAEYAAREKAFEASLKPWTDALAAFKAAYPGVPVAVTEPVGDYMLQAAGAAIKTPFALEAAIMNDTDPAPQDITTQNALFIKGEVKALVYNQQVTDPLTTSFLDLARKHGIPVVAVYETMPSPGYHYQNWMLAEIEALKRAVAGGLSTETLLKPAAH